MRICFISHMLSHIWGGSEEYYYLAAKYAVEQGHEVITSIPQGEGDHPKLRDMRKSGVYISYRKSGSQDDNLPALIYNKFIRWRDGYSNVPHQYYHALTDLKEFKPDLICVNMGGTFNVLEHPDILWLLKELNKPFFLFGHVHEENKPYPYQYLEKIFALLSNPNCRKLYFISKRNMEVASRQIIGRYTDKFRYLRNICKFGIREPLDWPGNTVISFANIARLDCRNKGQDLLLNVLADTKWKERDWILKLYGVGPDERYLKELSEYYGLSERIIFLGQQNDIKEVWTENHALVLPSISEGTPQSIIEAQMLGRPAIVTDVGDSALLVKDGERGFVADAPTLKLIDEALERAWQQRNEWPAMGIAANQFIRNWIETNPGDTLVNNMIKEISL